MLLDIDDERLRLRVTFPAPDRARLTIEYPREEAYRRRVLAALSDLLRPPREHPPVGHENDAPTAASVDQDA